MASDGHAACIYNNIMYIHGGYVEYRSQFTLSLYALNLNTLVWSEMPFKVIMLILLNLIRFKVTLYFHFIYLVIILLFS